MGRGERLVQLAVLLLLLFLLVLFLEVLLAVETRVVAVMVALHHLSLAQREVGTNRQREAPYKVHLCRPPLPPPLPLSPLRKMRLLWTLTAVACPWFLRSRQQPRAYLLLPLL